MAVVTAALIRDDRKILIAKRGGGKKFGKQWEFPGGKLNRGETPEACLRREIREELNLEIQVDEHFCTVHHQYPEFKIELMGWVEVASDQVSLIQTG